jgi:Zn-dependent protease with chaperone function
VLVTGGAVRLTHIVGVTRFAVNELPNGELAAVLAHELGPSAF